jgi:hypothetical protein
MNEEIKKLNLKKLYVFLKLVEKTEVGNKNKINKILLEDTFNGLNIYVPEIDIGTLCPSGNMNEDIKKVLKTFEGKINKDLLNSVKITLNASSNGISSGDEENKLSNVSSIKQGTITINGTILVTEDSLYKNKLLTYLGNNKSNNRYIIRYTARSGNNKDVSVRKSIFRLLDS